MPAKLPFFDPSESLQQRWREAASPTRITAQIYVFGLLIAIGLLRYYLFPRSLSASPDGAYGSLSASESDGAKDETLGEIEAIYVYPIKSCAGVSVDTAQLTGQGFDLDRRWMVVQTAKEGKSEKTSLRDEPRLTLIQPVIDEGSNRLKLRLTEVGEKTARGKGRELGETETILRPSESELKQWKEVPSVEMYGDYADGRVAALAPGSGRKLSPSEWISEFLGYPVLLVHFDTTSSTARAAFPIFKPPTDDTNWSPSDRAELRRKRGIEFQDIYPLLVASLESLTFVRSQLSSALSSTDGDGRGGRAITGIDSTKWADPAALSMTRFRPNIVVKGKQDGGFGAFSEDSWERIWILPSSTSRSSEGGGDRSKAMLQLVARCQRCLLTAVDPITAEKDPSVPLKLLNRSRMRITKPAEQGGNGRAGPCFGMYAIPLPLASTNRETKVEQESVYGELEKGDTIRVRWRPYKLDDEPARKRKTNQPTNPLFPHSTSHRCYPIPYSQTKHQAERKHL